MFRVYVEGKSVPDLKKNLMTMAGALGETELRVEVKPVVPTPVEEAPIRVLDETNKPATAPVTRVHNPLGNGASHGTTNTLVDSRGIPWDERIHSGNKATNKDGSWRNRRGVDPELLAKIEAELPRQAASLGQGSSSQSVHQSDATHRSAVHSGATAQPSQVAPFVPPPVPPSVAAIPTTPSIPMGHAPAQPVQQAVIPQQQQYEQIPIPHTTKPAHTLETFRRNFVQTIHQLIAGKQIDQNYLESLKSYFKVGEIWDIPKDDHKSAEMFQSFVQAGLVTQVG